MRGTLNLMKRPVIFIIVGGLLLGILGGGAYLYFSKNSTPSPRVTAEPTPTIAPELLTWDDPAGFTMQYPKGLTVDKHDEDKINYAHVEFLDSKHPGGLIVWVKDLPKGVTDTDTWGKKAATPSSAISFDTTLGSQSAQKILVSQPVKTVTTGVVYDGVLWYVEATLTDDAYWQSVYDKIVQSFTFKPLPAQAVDGGASDDTAGGGGVDEEEVLE